MTSDSCERYLEDPEANAAHLAECAECRAFEASLADTSAPVGPRASLKVDALPMAAWEGASYRSWTLVIAGAIAVAVIATLLFAVTGTSPIELFRGRVPSKDIVSSLMHLGPGFIQNAPGTWQIFIVVSFVVVNAIFIALLRRAPRGIDV
jgi:hypothetical protein